MFLLPLLYVGKLSYLFFSKSYIDENFCSKILKYRHVIQTRGYKIDDTPGGYDTPEEYHSLNENYKALCQTNNAVYFEINGGYQKEIEKVCDWLDEVIKHPRAEN